MQERLVPLCSFSKFANKKISLKETNSQYVERKIKQIEMPFG